MKNTTKAIYLAVLGAAVCASSAWAAPWWTKDNLGAAWPDRGTRALNRQQAGNTFQHWFWQGKNEGMQFRCPSNNPDPKCQHHLSITRSRSTSTTQGFTINANGVSGLGILHAAFNAEHTRTRSTGMGLTNNVNVGRGEYAQPIAVQLRRWTRGAFHGAHFRLQALPRQTFVNGKLVQYQYDWAWRDFATYTYNQSVNYPYYTIVFRRGSPF
jgi:hypothetical protein